MLPDELEKRLDGIEDASKKGYPVRNLYKIACEPGLWLQAYVNRPGFPGECFICELRLPDHRF